MNQIAHPELHLKLTEPDRAEFVRYLEDFFAPYPNALTPHEVRVMTGYCRTTVNNWIAFGYVASAQLIDGPRIPKQSLIHTTYLLNHVKTKLDIVLFSFI